MYRMYRMYVEVKYVVCRHVMRNDPSFSGVGVVVVVDRTILRTILKKIGR